MITQRVIDWLVSALLWLIGQIPPLPESVAGFLGTVSSTLSSVFVGAAPWSQLIPFAVIANVLAVMVSVYTAVFAIHLFGRAIALFTGRKVLPNE